jgi:putative ABC transport system permease protein
VGLGDTLTLDTPAGPQPFRIVLVYTDYCADIGILFTTRAAYTRIFRDDLVDLYSVYVKAGGSAARIGAQIAERFGTRYGLLALDSERYKHDLIGLIERSMTLARATELVAVVVAGLGIINALLVGVLDRRREIGVLLGSALSAYMVREALSIEVGWHIPVHFSGWVFAETFALAMPVAALAAWWPIRWASRLEVVDALQYE